MPDNVMVRSKRNWLTPIDNAPDRLPVFNGYKYRYGDAYNHGLLPARYPVPDIQRDFVPLSHYPVDIWWETL